MSASRAWVRLGSGRRLDLLDPSPFDWEDADMAVCLARTYRWGGHSCWDLPLSVAQHSLTVLAIREKADGPLSATDALRELLHDADEGLLGFDPITPVKPHLGEGYQSLAGRLQRAIAQRYGLRPWTVDSHAAHKRADRMAAASEALHVVGWTRAELRATLRIRLAPLAEDPLAQPPGLQPWEPWPPKLAAALFLGRLQALMVRQKAEKKSIPPIGPAAKQAVLPLDSGPLDRTREKRIEPTKTEPNEQ